MRKGSLVMVDWLDSTVFEAGQFDIDDDRFGASVMRTVGFLIQDTKSHIVVARESVTDSDSTQYRGCVCIVRKQILLIRSLIGVAEDQTGLVKIEP